MVGLARRGNPLNHKIRQIRVQTIKPIHKSHKSWSGQSWHWCAKSEGNDHPPTHPNTQPPIQQSHLPTSPLVRCRTIPTEASAILPRETEALSYSGFSSHVLSLEL